MNTFWLKVAIVAVVVLGVIIAVISWWPAKSQSPPEPAPGANSVYEVWEKDDKMARAEPVLAVNEPPAEESNEPKGSAVPNAPIKTVNPPEAQPMPQFEELSIEDKVQAEKLFEMALFHRKQARLPGMSYKKMVDYCREIIQRWPDSEYAFKAKRMLRHMPEQYRQRYNITEEEIDLGGLK
jgi:type IV secretory pathway VirB10-like protein